MMMPMVSVIGLRAVNPTERFEALVGAEISG